MSFEFTVNGKKATSEDLQKMNQGPAEGSEDQKDMAMGLAALKRMKEMKGQKMPESLEGQLKSVEGSLGKKGIGEVEQSDEAKELKASLDLLENIKRKKRGESMRDINVDGLSEEDQKDFLEAQQGLNAIAEKEGEKNKVCQNCGKENMMSANFCRSCGSKFEKEEEKKKEEMKITCPKCGNKIDADSRFCGKCGEPQIRENEVKEEKVPMSPEEGKKSENPSENLVSEKEEKAWSEADLEAATKDRASLLGFLDKVDGIQGSVEYYKQEELKKIVTDSLDKLKKIDMKDKPAVMEVLKYVTNQGEIKLRDKVYQVALKEKLQSM